MNDKCQKCHILSMLCYSLRRKQLQKRFASKYIVCKRQVNGLAIPAGKTRINYDLNLWLSFVLVKKTLVGPLQTLRQFPLNAKWTTFRKRVFFVAYLK